MNNSCTLQVGGMDCASCAGHVETAIRRLDGVVDVHVDLMSGRVRVACDEGVGGADLVGAVRGAGYDARVAPPAGRPSQGERRDAASLRIRILLAGVAGAAWAGSLAAARAGAGSAAAVLAIGSMVAGGWFIVPRGVRAALNRALDMNFLMSLAAFGALLIGEYEEAASALFLFAVAQLLEARSMERARDAIRGLMQLAPAEATVLRGGAEVRVPAESVAPGERVIVRPGERIAVDGVVAAGRSAVNQAAITGESVPVEKDAGVEVFAGTVNGDGVLEVRTTRAAADTTLARIIHSVEEAQASRAPSQTFVERFARIYTPAVVATALLVFLLPPLVGAGSWSDWFYRSLVLLVVACPCALVISTPVTVVSALTGAARRGILIKGGLHLENAGRADAIALDKTGTLTEGRPAVVELVALGGATKHELLGLAAAAEARSEHPLAGAVLRRAAEAGIDTTPAREAAAVPGRGVVATVGDARVLVGSESMFREAGGVTPAVEAALARLREAGRTTLLVGRLTPDGVAVLGLLGVADRPRAGAASSLRALRSAGIRRVVVLTGDHEAAARATVASIGAGLVDEVRAGLLPHDKVAAVRELRAAGGRVLMVGDGVNDAPALAAADVGVAMGASGTDVALETADIALMGDDLDRLPEAVRYARRAERIIRANIAFALLTKAVFVLLAVAGVATLWMAVLADMGASLLVIANGLRALRPGRA